jgi:hypothetical protein
MAYSYKNSSQEPYKEEIVWILRTAVKDNTEVVFKERHVKL